MKNFKCIVEIVIVILTISLTLNVIDPGSSLLKSFNNDSRFKLKEVRVCVSLLKIILSRLHGHPAKSTPNGYRYIP